MISVSLMYLRGGNLKVWALTQNDQVKSKENLQTIYSKYLTKLKSVFNSPQLLPCKYLADESDSKSVLESKEIV